MNDTLLKQLLTPTGDIEADGYQPLPPGVALDPALAEAGSPWLNEYIKFSSTWSPESYEGYHDACGIWLLSTIAAGRPFFYFAGHKQYTNLYIVLAGPSDLCAKSTAINLTWCVLYHIGLDWFLMPDWFDDEYFLTILANAVPPEYDELWEEDQEQIQREFGFNARRGWLHPDLTGDIEHMLGYDTPLADIGSLLHTVYDWPERYEEMPEMCHMGQQWRPYLTLLTELNPRYMFSDDPYDSPFWRKGLTARFAMVMPPQDLPFKNKRFPNRKRVVPDTVSGPLLRWHERLGLPEIETEYCSQTNKTTMKVIVPIPATEYQIDQIYDAFCDYDKALLMMIKNRFVGTDLAPSYARLSEKALRVAVLLASLEDEKTVQLRHWARAQQMAEGWRASLHHIQDAVLFAY